MIDAKWLDRRRVEIGWFGAAALLPGVCLVTAGMLHSFFNVSGLVDRMGILAHPVLILGGLMTAMALNLSTLLRVKLDTERGSIDCALVFRKRAINLAVCGLAACALFVVLVYVFIENYDIVWAHP